jgi:hypothetical protein
MVIGNEWNKIYNSHDMKMNILIVIFLFLAIYTIHHHYFLSGRKASREAFKRSIMP